MSGRTANIAVCQASLVIFITVLNLSIRAGPKLDDALAEALFFVGYDISYFHGNTPFVQGSNYRASSMKSGVSSNV
jgi:hypothetical protein